MKFSNDSFQAQHQNPWPQIGAAAAAPSAVETIPSAKSPNYPKVGTTVYCQNHVSIEHSTIVTTEIGSKSSSSKPKKSKSGVLSDFLNNPLKQHSASNEGGSGSTLKKKHKWVPKLGKETRG